MFFFWYTRFMRTVLKYIGVLLAVFLIGTGLDWIVHQMSEEYLVPFWYYRNKVIFGTILGLIVLMTSRRWTHNPRWLAFWVALLVAVLLQARYALLGYPIDFVVIFMGVHFVAFLIPAWPLFQKFRII